jgi:hypothetical protein
VDTRRSSRLGQPLSHAPRPTFRHAISSPVAREPNLGDPQTELAPTVADPRADGYRATTSNKSALGKSHSMLALSPSLSRRKQWPEPCALPSGVFRIEPEH